MINREGEFMPGAETRADDEAGLLRRTFRLIESMSRMTEPNGDGEDDANTLSRLLEISREIQRDRRRLRLLHKWTGE